MHNLYNRHIKLQWQIIERIAKLLQRFTLKDIQLATQFEPEYLKRLSHAVTMIQYKHLMSPSFAAEISRSHLNNKDKQHIIQNIPETISQLRKLIRTIKAKYPKKGAAPVKVPNSRFNKQLFFLKRKLYTSDKELRDVILKELGAGGGWVPENRAGC